MRRKKKRRGQKGGSSPGVLTVTEVAELLHVHINTVRNWSDWGMLRAYRIGTRRDRRFRREDIVAFLEGSAVAGHSKVAKG